MGRRWRAEGLAELAGTLRTYGVGCPPALLASVYGIRPGLSHNVQECRMRLRPNQHTLLDALDANVAQGAFDDGFCVLSDLRRDPTPALIPPLLPAFVPQALRRAHDSLPGPRWHWTYDLSISEATFRDELVGLIGECLTRAEADDLARLDEQCRSFTWSGSSCNHWRMLDVGDFMRCLPDRAEHRFVIVALATLHGSGYIRERAVQLLEEIHSGAELPFLLLRLNNWVEPVQKRALAAVQVRLRDDYAGHFGRWLVLLRRLSDAQRNRLSEVVAHAVALLAAPAGRTALTAQYGSRDRLLRRASLQVAVERSFGEERADALCRALRDNDGGTRMWAARVACAAEEHLSQLEQDPCGVIRVWALRARVERESRAALPVLRRALFDRAASVRATARFHLARLDPTYSVVAAYREALDTEQSATLLSSIISGLGEVGDRDDAALVAFHISSPSTRVANAAIFACWKLARTDCHDELLRALDDSRPSVSRSARRTLADAPLVLTVLRELVCTAEHTHAKLNATALMEGLERWDRLIGLVGAAADTQVEVGNAARAAIVRWLDKFGWRAPRPILPRADQRSQLSSLLEQLDDGDVRSRLGQVLSQT